jgi:orotate phosphoribosyltransferase
LQQDEILGLLAARRGHFRLESGHHGSTWLDLDQLLLQAGRIRRFTVALAARLAQYHVAAACGPLVGGALIAQGVAAELGVEFYYAERTVLPGMLAGSGGLYAAQYNIPASLRERIRGKEVAVIDDVINAGSAVRATMADLVACGARPVVAGALLVLGTAAPRFLGGQNLPLVTLGYLSSDLWTPDECPMCAAGVPLVMLG